MTTKSTRTDTHYLKIVMKALEPHLQYESFPANTRFLINQKFQSECYFVRSGAVSLYRYPDDVLLEVFDAPTVRGYIPLHKEIKSEYIIKVLMPSEIAVIDKDKLFSLLTELSLWEAFSRYQMALISSVSEVLYKLSSPNSYDSIRYQIIELMEKPKEIREMITAENYIRCKTRISRSSIMRILSDLKSGGYIVIERGILREVKNLPHKY
ncbi:helix-turn-helix domain-containing protein [Citrobacter sp. ku-bf4]|uniref:helix-turn-helix domain-containing protein n=1 Tax=Citrobacter TaxID=544 RepID=UPI001980B94C|nr:MULTISPECIES: helix-turn-helix domain-containing protein [Citrobacter]MBN6045655.1 helix-turn-helix domain-containing protein [Citrobacter sp. ku-bf4]MBS0827031.1 helix-turn-helix domain-containing protein [Citrobacter amalonaticus]